MKNQYVGDIGDYGKYGLLRFLSQNGITIGVNWYLTPNDGRTDGRDTDYLKDRRMKVYDPELYDVMGDLAFRQDKTIHMIEESGILDRMLFYNQILDLGGIAYADRPAHRLAWHKKALGELNVSDLIFADPDNGLSVNKKPTQKETQKYIIPNEIADYYNSGKDVAYYHHRSRMSDEGWMRQKTYMKLYLPEAELISVSAHRWNNRAYIFILHKNKQDLYKKLIDQFLKSAWGSTKVDKRVFFTNEPI